MNDDERLSFFDEECFDAGLRVAASNPFLAKQRARRRVEITEELRTAVLAEDSSLKSDPETLDRVARLWAEREHLRLALQAACVAEAIVKRRITMRFSRPRPRGVVRSMPRSRQPRSRRRTARRAGPTGDEGREPPPIRLLGPDEEAGQ